MTEQPATGRVSPALTWLLVVVGIAALVVAVVYFLSTADALPGFFPGHQSGSTHHHTTHAIAALVVGLLALLGAWMTAGSRTHNEPSR